MTTNQSSKAWYRNPLYLAVIGVTVVIISAMLFSYVTTMRVLTVLGPQIQASTDIRVNAMQGHLQLAEIRAGEEDITIDDINGYLNTSFRLIDGLLEGSSEPFIIPLEDQALRTELSAAREELAAFQSFAESTWAEGEEHDHDHDDQTVAVAGEEHDHDEDHDDESATTADGDEHPQDDHLAGLGDHSEHAHGNFDAFMGRFNAVETRLESLTTRTFMTYQGIQFSLVALVLAVAGGAGYAFFRFEKQREASIEALQASEKQAAVFRALVENATDGITLLDKHNRITYANPAFHKMHGYTNGTSDVVGKSAAEFVATGNGTPSQDDSESQLGQVDIEHKRVDGTTFYGAANSFPIQDNGSVVAVAEILRDVTEQRKAEAEQQRLQEEIITTQKNLIHDLATPIIPVMDGIIVMPLIGSIDSARAQQITRALLAGITHHRAKIVLLDITGVPVVDSGVADHLNKAMQAVRLKGARTIVSGISDAVAETIVDLGIEWDDVESLRDLQSGLQAAFASGGLRLIRTAT